MLLLAFFAMFLAGPSATLNAAPLQDYAILAESHAVRLLIRCDGPQPPGPERTWTPASADIAKLEAALPALLNAQERPDRDAFIAAPEGWVRQYVGIIRDGRRIVYGNFLPKSAILHYDREPEWRKTPMVMCDGGPAFFGVEFDIESGAFMRIAFDAAGPQP